MTTSVLERGVCRVCNKKQKIRKSDGKIGKHGLCNGAGRKPKKEKKTKKTDTKVAVCLDRSGSMHSLKAGALKAFNQLCEPIRDQGDDYRAYFYTFGGTMKTEWTDKKPKKLPLLDTSNYHPSGGTPMFDAMHQAIKDMGDDGTSSYLVITITDGFENASRTINAAQLAKLIKAKQATDRWTFAVSVPKGQKESLSKRLGIPVGNFEEWEQTSRGVSGMGVSNKSAVSRYVGSRERGLRSAKEFYVDVNVGRESAKKVAKKLEEVAKGRFRKLKTTAATAIRPFIESKNLTFVKGACFYALQKPEKVQSYKEIILERKDNGKLYGGAAVRATLGIPEGTDGKIKPGNLGEWNVWVQSTSLNRKLLAKMEVLFDKTK